MDVIYKSVNHNKGVDVVSSITKGYSLKNIKNALALAYKKSGSSSAITFSDLPSKEVAHLLVDVIEDHSRLNPFYIGMTTGLEKLEEDSDTGMYTATIRVQAPSNWFKRRIGGD